VISSGIGHVALGFSHLEDSLNAAVAALLKTDSRAASIVAAEISFKAKVHILSSLVRERAGSREFNCGTDDPIEVFQELVSLLFRAEELRNQVMHSSWVHLPNVNSILSEGRRTIGRRKITAKASRGLSVRAETLSGDDLLDIYDFILNVEYVFDEFFMDDSFRGDSRDNAP
jgi:hypothetical protein